ncbi:MAG TPA: hypothetical protein VIK02_02925 [Candidatus Anoxymicrobiaceae bacterium]
MMFLKNPVRNTLLYLSGFTLTLATLGVVSLLAMHAGSLKKSAAEVTST